MPQNAKTKDERTKLSATFLNNIAVAMVVTGLIVPLASYTYDVPGAAMSTKIQDIGFLWVLAGFSAHFIARLIIRGLQP
jgi:hypothetical protein